MRLGQEALRDREGAASYIQPSYLYTQGPFAKPQCLAEGVLLPSPRGPQAERAPGRASRVHLACGSSTEERADPKPPPG